MQSVLQAGMNAHMSKPVAPDKLFALLRELISFAPVGAAEGNYETPAKLRAFLAEKRISLSPEDRAELETLLPAKTPVLVSEL